MGKTTGAEEFVPKLNLTALFNADHLPVIEYHQAWPSIRYVNAATFYVLVELGGIWIRADQRMGYAGTYLKLKMHELCRA
jgi:hypothetical protein